MKLTGIDKFKKYAVKVDGICVSEFFSQRYYSVTELRQMETEYAVANHVSESGVRIHITRNNRMLDGKIIMPHYGRVA